MIEIKLEKYIEQQIKKFDITDTAIAELSKKYMSLTIDGIDDKLSFAAVKTARLHMKKLRCEVDNKRKELKEDALIYGRKIDAEAKRVTQLMEPIEEHLAMLQFMHEQEIELIKKEREEFLSKRNAERTRILTAMDFRLDGSMLIRHFEPYLDSPHIICSILLSDVYNYDDDVFLTTVKKFEETFLKDKNRLLEIEIAKKHAEEKAEAERKAAHEALMIEQFKAKEERDRLAAEAEKLRLENEALKKAAKEQERLTTINESIKPTHPCFLEISAEFKGSKGILPSISDFDIAQEDSDTTVYTESPVENISSCISKEIFHIILGNLHNAEKELMDIKNYLSETQRSDLLVDICKIIQSLKQFKQKAYT